MPAVNNRPRAAATVPSGRTFWVDNLAIQSIIRACKPGALPLNKNRAGKLPKMRASLASVLLACLMSAFFPQPNDAQKFEADLVVVNANVRTMDARRPVAEAVAVFGNRIAAVGTNEEIRRLAGAHTRVVDARGALVLPGFNDSHVHFLSGGFQLSSVDLRDAATPQEFAERIRRFAEKLEAARAAPGQAASHGVTSVQDMSAGNDVGVYQTLLDRGELKTRIYGASPLPDWERLGRVGILRAFGGDMLRIGALKGFSDGSLGSTTALFFEPYNDAPTTRGLPADEMFPEGVMLKRVKAADAAGLQVMIHAIGDKANDTILSIYEQVAREHGERDRRFRIEHAQHLRPQDIARFGRDHIVASMQPYHCIDDGRWAEKRIGHERAKTTYAFRSLLDTGAVLAFGSDWTVAPLDPVLGIYAATTRRTLDDKNPGGWVPEQKITVEEAVRAYTVGSAYAEFAENSKGTITPGKLADLVILSEDIFKIDPVEIEKVRVRTTIMDGRVVYEAAKQ